MQSGGGNNQHDDSATAVNDIRDAINPEYPIISPIIDNTTTITSIAPFTTHNSEITTETIPPTPPLITYCYYKTVNDYNWSQLKLLERSNNYMQLSASALAVKLFPKLKDGFHNLPLLILLRRNVFM